MEHFALSLREFDLILVKTTAESPQPFGPTKCLRSCLAGEQTRVAWEDRPATTAAMVTVACGRGLVTTVTTTANVIVVMYYTPKRWHSISSIFIENNIHS
jgi:hypothetical protein